MKKTIVMLSAICFFALAAQANKPTTTASARTKQEAPAKHHESPEQRAQQSVDKLDKIVGLSADQKTQVHDLAMTRIKTVASIREKYKGQADKKDAMKEEIKGARKEYRSSVRKLLTPDQIKKLNAYHKENKGKAEEDVPTSKD